MIASLIIIVFIVAVLTSPSPTFKNDKFVNSGRGREAKYICLLPPYPQHGRYTVSNHPFATPGDSYPCVKLDITCEFEYIIGNATNSIFCINGEWSAAMPKCHPNSAFCTLNDDLKVEYHCSSHPRTLEHSQECPSLVPTETVVRPICRSPAYFSLRVLSEMHYKDGIWDYNPICKPACGLITQHRKLEGSSTKHVELPWHAAIYKKWPESCYYACSGSLITANKIISEHVYSISRIDFFEEWLKHTKNEKNSRVYVYLSSKFHFGDITESSRKEINLKISNFSNKIGTKWLASGKSKERFLIKNKTWLDEADIQFTASSSASQPSTSSGAVTPAGRPRKDFEESSFKTKKRRVVDLVESRSVSELVTAAEIAVRSTGQRKIANVIRDISENPVNIKKSKNTSSVIPRQLSSDETLAYYIDSKSTTHAYKQTRKWSMKAGHNVFPSYFSLRKSKQACHPAEEHIAITETRAEINLQALLNKTVERLILAQNEVISSVLPTSSSFTLVSKWGCDGSSGHSTHKQRFENTEDTDEFLFVFSLVPLKLYDGSKIIWQNPRPSSTMYCRPIKFIFAKETNDFTLAETNRLLEEVNDLLPTLIKFDDSQISVKHELLLTMTDGKVCNALTETRSSQKCFICGATPKTMNDDPAKFNSNQEHFGFGLSTLHAWIRCFECLLHISYKLNIKKWQARSDEDKADIKVRSEEIKLKFKNKMGLIVDKAKPGFGSSNDGNTARRFFKNAEMSAHITGLDVTIIKQFDVILRTLSSGFEINLAEFNKFCLETRRHFLSLYSWYCMPATVHKILIHSTEVIKAALLPIGQLSEEAQEACNKDCRRFREYNTRKCSRVATNRDLLSMLVITSDPLINSLREIPRKKPEKICTEVLKLIVSPSIVESRPESSSYCRTMPQNDEDYTIKDSSEDSDDDY